MLFIQHPPSFNSQTKYMNYIHLIYLFFYPSFYLFYCINAIGNVSNEVFIDIVYSIEHILNYAKKTKQNLLVDPSQLHPEAI